MKLKPTFTRMISEQEWSWTILSLALIFGAIIRILPVLLVDFPINDGGMFVVMIDDLISNGFVLPSETSYNNLKIPFAYPPLAFYFGAFLQFVGLSVGTLFLWVPALLSIAILPFFYLFALEVFKSRPHAATATVFLALAPGTYVWYLMGGGLTRALGAIFFLRAMTFSLRAFRGINWKTTLCAALFCGLTVLTHPQAALLTLTGCAVLWLVHGRSSCGIISACAIAVGAALFSFPWWMDVVFRHGFQTLISGGQSGSLQAPLLNLITGLTLRQTILPFATMFWILGLGWAIYKCRMELLFLVTLLYFIDQRSAPAMSSYILPLLAAYGFLDVLPSILFYIRKREWESVFDEVIFNRPAFSIGLLGIIFYLFIECVFHTNVIVKLSLSSDAREMMSWIYENASSESRFLIVTGREDAMTDPVQEWFPVLANRHSVTTLQGMEWVLANQFNERWNMLNMLQSCEDSECIISRSQTYQLTYTNIILDVNEVDVASFKMDGYSILFQNERYVVFEVR